MSFEINASILRSKYLRRAVAFYMAAVSVSMLGALLFDRVEKQQVVLKDIYPSSGIYKNTNQLQEDLLKKIQQAEENIKIYSEISPETVSGVNFNVRLSELKQEIKAVKSESLAIRQAINPINPEEILTIARLTDEIRSLKKELVEFKDTSIQNQKSFEVQILRELDSSHKWLNLILLLIAPIVLQFLITLWSGVTASKKES